MVEMVLIVVLIYMLLGVLFVVPFLIKGLAKVDEGAHGGTKGFKIIIIPGVIVFWPVLLKKWMKRYSLCVLCEKLCVLCGKK